MVLAFWRESCCISGYLWLARWLGGLLHGTNGVEWRESTLHQARGIVDSLGMSGGLDVVGSVTCRRKMFIVLSAVYSLEFCF